MINLLIASISLVAPATRPASLHRPVVQRPLVVQQSLVSRQPLARSHIVMEEPNLDEQRLEAVSRSGDPFRAIRYVLYGIFGLVGVAGVGVGLMQGDVQNAGINAGVAVGAGARVEDAGRLRSLVFTGEREAGHRSCLSLRSVSSGL